MVLSAKLFFSEGKIFVGVHFFSEHAERPQQKRNERKPEHPNEQQRKHGMAVIVFIDDRGRRNVVVDRFFL